MKLKLWLAALVLAVAWVGFLASPAAAAIAFVQDAQNLDDSGATSTTIAATWAAATTTGHLVVGWCGWNDTGTANLLSVTDSQGNTYSLIGAKIRDTGNNQSHQLFFSANITGGAGSVTCTLSELQNFRRIGIAEYSGVATTAPLDGNANNFQAGAPTTTNGVTSTSITTTAVGDLIFAATQNDSDSNPGGATISAGTGFTARTITGTGNGIGRMEDQVQAAAGAIAGTFTISLSKNMLTGVAAFNALVCAAVPDASYVAVNAQNGQAIVYWSSANPVIILRKTAAFAGEAPVNGTAYTAGTTIGAATVVYDGTTAVAGTTCTWTSCTQTTLTNGTTYDYKVFAQTGTGGSSCYAPGTVNTTAGVVARPASGVGAPTWSYSLAGGSILKGGTAGTGTLYATSNASQIVGLNTLDGTQSWAPAATNAAIQAWLTWLPAGGGRTGSVAMSTTTQTVSIATVDPTRAFVVCWSEAPYSDPAIRVTCELSASAVTLTNTEANPSQGVQWYVVEFPSGVSVQRGLATFATTDSTVNVPLTTVDLTKSFVLISERMDTTNQTIDEQWTTRALLTSSTNLELSRNATGTALTVAWQVVTMQAASVQRGTTSINSSAQNYVTVPLSPAVNPSQSFLVFSRRGPATGGIEADYQVTGEITGGGSTLIFTRVATKINSVDIAWEVVSLSDGTTVQRGTVISDTTDNPLNATLSPAIATTRSIPLISVRGAEGPPYTFTSDLDSTSWNAIFTSSTNLRFQRVSSKDTIATIAWQVVQFASGTTTTGPSVIGVDQGTGAANSGSLYFVEADSGSTNWQVTLTGADQFQAAPAAQVRQWSDAAFQAAYTGDVIFAPTLNTVPPSQNTNNKVFALDASTGAVLWTFSPTMDGVQGMPYVDYSRDRIYVTSCDGSADCKSGTQQSLWVIKTVDGEGVLKGQARSCPACTTPKGIKTSPTLSYNGQTLYVGDNAGTLYAINAGLLTVKWSLALTPAGTTVVGFVWEDYVTTGRLYFAASDGTVRCLQDNGTSGSACAGWTSPSGSFTGTPLELGKLFVGSWDPAGPVGQKGQLNQINLTTGALENTVVVGNGEKQPGDVSTETGNEIFVGTTEGVIYKFPLTGGSL